MAGLYHTHVLLALMAVLYGFVLGLDGCSISYSFPLGLDGGSISYSGPLGPWWLVYIILVSSWP